MVLRLKAAMWLAATPPALVKSPPTTRFTKDALTVKLFMARATPLTPVTAPGPTATQFVPSKRAMWLSVVAPFPDAVNAPAAYVLLFKRSSARTESLRPVPIADQVGAPVVVPSL